MAHRSLDEVAFLGLGPFLPLESLLSWLLQKSPFLIGVHSCLPAISTRGRREPALITSGSLWFQVEREL